MARLRFAAAVFLFHATLLRFMRLETSLDAGGSMRADDAQVDVESDSLTTDKMPSWVRGLAANAGFFTPELNMSKMAPVRTQSSGCRCKEPLDIRTDNLLKALSSEKTACDWCYTEGDCGESTWQYCTYPPEQDSYEWWSHNEKHVFLWNKVYEKKGTSGEKLGWTDVISSIMGESMRTPFDNFRDVNPPGRKKAIHSQGVHCQFALTIDQGPSLTGLLYRGTHYGIIRLGNALSLDNSPKVIFPGVAVKFLRSGVHSGNFVALRKTGQGGSFDFFNGTLSNHVAPPPELEILGKFAQASACASMVGLSDLCRYSQNGYSADPVSFPYEILLDGQFSLPANSTLTDKDLLRKLQGIPSGTNLFKVSVRMEPGIWQESEPILIGTLRTTSECVTSSFGDKDLSFRHQRMEEDFRLQPNNYLSKVGSARETDLSERSCNAFAIKEKGGSLESWKCPGSHMMKAPN